MKKLCRFAVCMAVFVWVGAGYSFAGEVDILVQKLVDKGILSAGEAQQILTETKEEVKRQNAQGTNVSLPAWVQNTKLKGDFRTRYEWTHDKIIPSGTPAESDRSRARIRVRVGEETIVNNKLKVGVGIATGGNDPRSRNITLGWDGTNTNDPGVGHSIVLDYAFAEYAPSTWATMWAGKFQNNLWRPCDMLWKGDITPEGAALNLKYKFDSIKTELFMNNLLFLLYNNDSAGSKTPLMVVLQPGFSTNVTSDINLKGAFGLYGYEFIKDQPKFTKSSLTNSFNPNQGASAYSYAFNYNAIQPSGEISFKEPLWGLVPYASIFGDYVYNICKDVTTSRSGFDAGVKFGNEKVEDWKQWKATLAGVRLGRDAWLDILTDADRFGGRTDIKGFTSALDFGLGKNTWASVKYYYTWMLDKDYQGVGGTTTQVTGYAPEQLLQLDWNMKF